MRKKSRNAYRYDYCSESRPNSEGKATIYHKPRRDYWGNLFDEDTVEGAEPSYIDEDGSNSLIDTEDDHDCFL